MKYSLEIHNFKCHKSQKVNFNRLTVFTGENGAGKSTIIQSLLLIRKFLEEGCEKKFIELNNEMFSFGIAPLLLNDENNDTIKFKLLERDNLLIELSLKLNQQNNLILDAFFQMGNSQNKMFLEDEFYYLNAERIGPRINSKIINLEYLHVGYKGENCAQIMGNPNVSYQKIEKDRTFRDIGNDRLIAQVKEWVRYILPGTELTEEFSEVSLTAQIKVGNSMRSGNYYYSTNVGFGVSYLLPIIINGLIAKKEKLFIVENPEAHLHPAAQSKLGQFLAKIANSGVNVVVETHSEHIIHSIQLAKLNNIISKDDILINFLEQTEKENKISEIFITDLGELTKWPEGFFDQSQNDLKTIFLKRRDA